MKYIQVRIYGAAARKLRTAARKNGRSSSQEATQIVGNHYGFQMLMKPIKTVEEANTVFDHFTNDPHPECTS